MCKNMIACSLLAFLFFMCRYLIIILTFPVGITILYIEKFPNKVSYENENCAKIFTFLTYSYVFVLAFALNVIVIPAGLFIIPFVIIYFAYDRFNRRIENI